MKKSVPPPPSNPAAQLKQLLSRLCHVSASLSPADLQRVFRVVEGWKAAQQVAIIAALEDSPSEPLLLQYSSDTTPKVAKSSILCQAGSTRVRRRTERSHEFLVQHLLISRQVAGQAPQTYIYIDEPKVLQHGKTMHALGAIAAETSLLSMFPASVGRIRILHQVYDRAAGQDLFHVVAGQWQQSSAPDTAGVAASSQARSNEENLFAWAVWTNCAAHDCHNALKWSTAHVHDQGPIHDNVYVAVKAFRFCYSQALENMSSWLGSCLEDVDASQLPDPDCLANLWLSLGVGEELVHILASDMRLHWTGVKLQVQTSFLQSQDWLSTLSATLMSLWSFQSFSASRWLTVGRACKGLLRGLLSGFLSMIAHLKKEKKASSFYTAGTEKLNSAEWRYISITAFASALPEALVSELLADARLPRRLDQLQAELCNQFSYLEGLEGSVWDLVGTGSGMSGQDLRSEALTASLVAWSFIQFRVFFRASQYPWSLTCGDVNANLETLRAMSAPHELVTWKIWSLLQVGFNRPLLAKAVNLLGQCCWTTHLAEKQHAGVSITKRHHPDVSASNLSARGFLLLARQTLHESSSVDKAFVQWERRWAKLQSAAPNRISGRHLYLKDAMTRASYAEAHGKRRHTPFDRSKIMREHGLHWAALSEEQKHIYNSRAMHVRSEALHAHAQAVESLLDSGVALREQQMAQTSLEDEAPNILHAVTIPDAFWSELVSNVDGQFSGGQALKRKRMAAEGCPKPIEAHQMQAILAQSPLDFTQEQMTLPEWAKRVCRLREQFRTAIFEITQPDGQRFYRFMFAILKPISLMLMPLEPVSRRATHGLTPATWAQDFHDNSTQAWSFVPGHFCRADVLGAVPLSSVRVLMSSYISQAGSVQSLDLSVPLSESLDGLEADTEEPSVRETKKQGAATAVSEQSTIDSQLPPPSAGSCSDLKATSASAGSVSASSGVALQVPHVDSADPLDEDETGLLTSLSEELKAGRENMATLGPDLRHFRIALLGDSRLVARKGPHVHGVLASIRAGCPLEGWAIRVGMSKSARFEISVYSEAGASALAHAWCDRMTFLYDLWCRRADDAWPYDDDALAAYQPPEALQGFLQQWSSRQCKRAREVMSLVPSK